MGRQVRRVTKNWEHPKEDHYGEMRFKPLFEGCDVAQLRAEWDEEEVMWLEGKCKSYSGDSEWEDHNETIHYSEYNGPRPDYADYMPDWSEEEKTHLMMYEDTTEGTPISPAFETPEELAHWLADNGASSFGDDTATYEQWLSMIGTGWAPSMVLSSAGIQSGVEFASND